MFDVLKPPPPGAAAAASIARRALWARARQPLRERDRALTGTARRWLRELPPRQRPLQLCIAHPRVANRIAWNWSRPESTEQVLDDLLTDRRGGRRGFAPAIVRELQRLREFNDRQRRESRPETLIESIARIVGVA